MISLVVFRCGKTIRGFRLSGHSGYAKSGRDIVCAAVSSAAGLAECAVSDVLQLDADIRIEEKDALLSLMVSPNDAERPECRTLFEAFYRHMNSLTQDYPQFIDISEVQIP
jgi:uncharacterized protein YsxB (DUF464 family)